MPKFFQKFMLLFILSIALGLAACTSESVTASPFDPIVRMPEGNVVVTFIDVGQGDATLIQTNDGNMLIDGGLRSAYEHILSILDQRGVTELAYVVATHPHADHIGGLTPLISNNNGINVQTVLMPNVVHTTRTYENFLEALIDGNITVREPYPGKQLALGDAIFTVLAPNSSGYNSLNNYSIVLHMTHGENSFLFAADAERESEEEILATFDDISADVLRVGHHGSRTSTTPDFLASIAPRYAIISAGYENRYGHPHSVVIERLYSSVERIFRTYVYGDITMTSDGTSIYIDYR